MPTGKARKSLVVPGEPAESEEFSDTAEAVDGADDADDADDADGADGAAETPDPTVVFVERQPAGRRIKAAVIAAAALFVAAGAFAGAALQPYLADRNEVATKFDIARTAANAITTLWTYTPDNMETLADRSSVFLGGDFKAEYRKYVDAIVPTNKQAQVTNTTDVVATAVESLDGPDATAIVYTNSTATSPLTKGIPSMRYLSYRLTMKREDARWLVTKMTTVTSLDLTPQL